jgi:hypothetical protein
MPNMRCAMRSFARLAFRRRALAPFAVAVLVLPLAAEASPITWFYSGTVGSSFNSALVPAGSAATVLLTVDPAANLVAGSPYYGPNAGQYLFSAIINFTGRQYTLRGAYEVNWDIAVGYPLPGSVPIRYLSLSGPSLDPGATGYYDYRPALYWCNACYWDWETTDRTSSAFPGPFADVFFRLYFIDPDSTTIRGGLPIGEVTVTASNPQPVPEPSTWLLLGTGLAAVAARRRGRQRR